MSITTIYAHMRFLLCRKAAPARAAQAVDKPHGRLGGPQARNLNRRSGHCRGQPSFRLISSGSLCPSGNGPQGHRFPPSTSKCNPAPATCAVDSEALRSKVSLRRSPPGGAEGSRRATRPQDAGVLFWPKAGIACPELKIRRARPVALWAQLPKAVSDPQP